MFGGGWANCGDSVGGEVRGGKEMKNLFAEVEQEDGRGKQVGDNRQIHIKVSAMTDGSESELVFHSVFIWQSDGVIRSVIEDKCKEAPIE